jgi:hypothetical protein
MTIVKESFKPTRQNFVVLKTYELSNLTIEWIDFVAPVTQDQVPEQLEKVEEKVLLKYLPEAEGLIIDAVDGTEGLATANRLFRWGVDTDFNKIRTTLKHPCDKQGIHTYKVLRNATFKQVFDAFTIDLDNLCFIEHQIKNFCEKNYEWLLQVIGRGVFFLFKEGSDFFVAVVHIHSNGHLSITKYLLNECNYTFVIISAYGYYVVIPDQAGVAKSSY